MEVYIFLHHCIIPLHQHTMELILWNWLMSTLWQFLFLSVVFLLWEIQPSFVKGKEAQLSPNSPASSSLPHQPLFLPQYHLYSWPQLYRAKILRWRYNRYKVLSTEIQQIQVIMSILKFISRDKPQTLEQHMVLVKPELAILSAPGF